MKPWNFNNAKKFFGTSIFSMKINNAKLLINGSNLSNSLKSSMNKIKYQNLRLSDQIYNLGCINLNSLINDSDNKVLDLFKEENLEFKDLILNLDYNNLINIQNPMEVIELKVIKGNISK